MTDPAAAHASLEGISNDQGDVSPAVTVAPSSPKKDPRSCILRKGDLVRISERREARAKNRDGGLGRIYRSTPIPEEQLDGTRHPFRYDVDWVLGGRLTNVERHELVYTTADAEGLTEDGTTMRSRRARKPPTLDDEITPITKKKKAPAKKKKPPASKNNTKTKKGASTSKGGKGGGAKRKPIEASNGKKAGAAKRQKTEAARHTDTDDAENDGLKNLFDKHRREFERCFARLEKVDGFGFFLGEAPPDFDEKYEDCDQSSHMENSTGASQAQPIAFSVFPAHPPFNWEMVHRRATRGRYILDRVQEAEGERKRIRSSEGLEDTPASGKRGTEDTLPRLVNPKGVNWDLFREDVTGMCDSAVSRDPSGESGGSGTLSHSANKIKDVLEQIYQKTGKRQQSELAMAESRRKFTMALKSASNTEAAMQGKWLQKPFPERKYQRLTDNVVCAGLSQLDERNAIYELQTNLPDSFIGLSYTYNDTGQSESWMKSVVDETGKTSSKKKSNGGENERQLAEAMAADNGVVRAQVQASMSTLLIAVQDRVMTESGVLKQPELRSANWDGDKSRPAESLSAALMLNSQPTDPPALVEQPVWGIDCYTRRNIMACLEVDFEATFALEFIERWLLPAINACPADLASDLASAARILEGLPLPAAKASEGNKENLPADTSGEVYDERWSHSLLGSALKEKLNASAPAWLKLAASRLREAIGALGYDFFRVHPKGHGSIVLKSRLQANTLVTYYRGEVYPSWRWGEKMDAIEMTQKRLGLRPNLPDFYNMALERPQLDPRGYGLLFVDASRKAGHGSSLSHSCAPTCEVRVTALHGKLCLALTTIRDLELGEELTFDYNAVTESLGEYSSAVCLCGHRNCRGSFLHFATADCYQQVLNRNFPIAVRFANLVKGCTKQVMSEEDSELLKSHGFGTAAFGAVSVGYHQTREDSVNRRDLDVMINVPIWLRTYVADTLRYIEYERRALPVSLLCNHFSSAYASPTNGSTSSQLLAKKKAEPKRGQSTPLSRKTKPKPFGPEVAFQHFSRKQKPFFLSQLKSQGITDVKGPALQKALRKVAVSAWNALGEGLKKQWEQEARAEWRKTQKVKKQAKRKSEQKADQARKRTKEKDFHDDELAASTISFEAADAEGMMAMEQRIQQLTQALSRVGRVLGRHRETVAGLCISQSHQTDAASFAPSIASPLSVLPEKEVVQWIWNDMDGIVQTLLRCCETEPCVSPSLLNEMRSTVLSLSSNFVGIRDSAATDASRSDTGRGSADRDQVNDALLKVRNVLLKGILAMDVEMKNQQLERERRKAQARRDALKKRKNEDASTIFLQGDGKEVGLRAEVAHVLRGMVDTVEARTERASGLGDTGVAMTASASEESGTALDIAGPLVEVSLSPWLRHYQNKWKLEAAADLLLLYVHTSMFFVLKPYQSLVSTPIEVYARELGNRVPKSVVEVAHGKQDDCVDAEVVLVVESQNEAQNMEKKHKRAKFCQPDDVITNVTVAYSGDYVLSQLLQWSNGGIGQKKGLPDLLGCVALPSMSGCWRDEVTKTGSFRKRKPDYYRTEIRPLLVDWLSDPRQRGSPLPEELRHIFSSVPRDRVGPVVFGSPVLDLLVSARDDGIYNILTPLRAGSKLSGEDSAGKSSKSTVERLQSTVDEGMPAQAVANWVQCENPDCLKWRRLPWHADVDVLPEKFFCSDNKWDPAASSCDAPEDTWDENDAQLKNEGVSKGSDRDMVSGAFVDDDDASCQPLEDPLSARVIKESDLIIGARFDVQRPNKRKFFTGIVIDKDFAEGTTTRVKFHYAKTSTKFDEWIDVASDRIFPLHSKQRHCKDQEQNVDGVGKTAKKEKSTSTRPKKTKKVPADSPNANHMLPEAEPKQKGTLPRKHEGPTGGQGRAANGRTEYPTVSISGEVAHVTAVQSLARKISQLAGTIAESVVNNRTMAAQTAQSASAIALEKKIATEMVVRHSAKIAETIIRGGSLGSDSNVANRSIMAALAKSATENSPGAEQTQKRVQAVPNVATQSSTQALVELETTKVEDLSNQNRLDGSDIQKVAYHPNGTNLPNYSAAAAHAPVGLAFAEQARAASVVGIDVNAPESVHYARAPSSAGYDRIPKKHIAPFSLKTQHIPTKPAPKSAPGASSTATPVSVGTVPSVVKGRIPKKSKVQQPASLIHHQALLPSMGGHLPSQLQMYGTGQYRQYGTANRVSGAGFHSGLHYHIGGQSTQRQEKQQQQGSPSRPDDNTRNNHDKQR